MNKTPLSHFAKKVVSALSILILCLFLCFAGCLQVPFMNKGHTDDLTPPLNQEISPIPEITPLPEQIPDLAFPPDMPPQIRERLMREGKIPTSGKNSQPTGTPITVPNPVPTSYVIQGDNSLSEDAFIPSRESIYFSNNTSWSGPKSLNPVYVQSGIPLNTTMKELKIHVEKGPFSVKYTVHPKSTPLVSWARITGTDSFQNIIFEDGYNREFSSEAIKEIFVYKEGNFTITLNGGYATLDISINTPDGTLITQDTGTTSARDIPDDMPPQLRERLMREGKL